jgi:hypothetical protein
LAEISDKTKILYSHENYNKAPGKIHMGAMMLILSKASKPFHQVMPPGELSVRINELGIENEICLSVGIGPRFSSGNHHATLGYKT